MVTVRQKQEILNLVSCFANKVNFIELTDELANKLIAFMLLNNKYLKGKEKIITVQNVNIWYKDVVNAVDNYTLDIDTLFLYWKDYEFIADDEVDEIDGYV